MINRKLLTTLAAGTLLLAAAPAFADGRHDRHGQRWQGHGHGHAHGHWKQKHHYYHPQRVVVVPPAPVVYAPRPVYVYPQPVYVAPRPTVVYSQPGFSLAVGF